MRLLAIESSTDACSVALWADEGCTEKWTLAPRQHARLLLKMVEEILQQRRLQLNELDVIAFAAGPASFTGVRLAASVAQGLAFAADLKVVPVSTLQVLAQTAQREYGITQAAVALDAFMGEVYWGCYRVQADGVMQAVVQDQLLQPQQITVAEGKWCAVGDAWRRYAQELPALPQQLVEIYPHAQDVAQLAIDSLQRSQPLSPEEAQPVYLRGRHAWRMVDEQ